MDEMPLNLSKPKIKETFGNRNDSELEIVEVVNSKLTSKVAQMQKTDELHSIRIKDYSYHQKSNNSLITEDKRVSLGFGENYNFWHLYRAFNDQKSLYSHNFANINIINNHQSK